MSKRATLKRSAAGTLALGLVLSLSAGRASAQTTVDRTGVDAGTTTRTNFGTNDRADQGFDLGWLGLLGLAGLAGLLPKKTVHHQTGNTSGRPIS